MYIPYHTITTTCHKKASYLAVFLFFCTLYYHQVIGESLDAYLEAERGLWVKEWPGQAVLAVTQFYWTMYVHEALRKGPEAMQEYLELNNKQIDEIVV